jgi:hypothetical protein
MSREVQDGFWIFRSGANYHCRCSATDCIAGGLEPVQGLQELLMADFLERLYKAQQSGRNVSKGCINSNVCKDSYNEAIENGYTTSEASVITELWLLLCGKLLNASYILGDYEVKVLRENIKTAMKTEQEGLLKSCLHQLLKKLLKRLQRKG